MLVPRLMVRLKKGVKRLDWRRQSLRQPQPADRAWQEMLKRLDAEETERRLKAMEQMLNSER